MATESSIFPLLPIFGVALSARLAWRRGSAWPFLGGLILAISGFLTNESGLIWGAGEQTVYLSLRLVLALIGYGLFFADPFPEAPKRDWREPLGLTLALSATSVVAAVALGGQLATALSPAVLTLAVTGGIIDEVLLRGWVLRGARLVGLAAWPAIGLQAGVHMVLHMSRYAPQGAWGLLVLTGLFGLATGWMALRYRTIFWGGLAHIVVLALTQV